MKTYEFAVIATGIDAEDDLFEDRFFEAGCSDATIAFQKGVIILDFARQAETFSKALVSAVLDVRHAGAHVLRIEPDNLVSLSDISRRAGLTRSAIAHYTNGARQDHFPAPAARVTSESPLWDWFEVANWLFEHDRLDREDVLLARLVREANLLISSAGADADDGFAERLREVELEPI